MQDKFLFSTLSVASLLRYRFSTGAYRPGRRMLIRQREGTDARGKLRR